MPRKNRIRSSEFPYHISARCNNKDWFAIPLDEVWEIFSRYLYFITIAYGVEIHAFVLMNNHYHLILSTPKSNIEEAMCYLQRETSRCLGQASDRINHNFGGAYNACLITDLNYYSNVYKYALRNPISAGIAQSVEEYAYSTLRGLLGFEHLSIPTFANEELFISTERTLYWLNSPPRIDDNELIRKALKRREFQIKRCRKSGKKPSSEEFRIL
ncbi:MAG: transposase [Bdellovibrionaceae bacterium]|nr:transposase [Pseudobdellovibrionaceae bacterium]